MTDRPIALYPVAAVGGIVGFLVAVVGGDFLPATGVGLVDETLPFVLGFGLIGLVQAYYHRETGDVHTRDHTAAYLLLDVGVALVLAGFAADASTAARLLLGGAGVAAAAAGNGWLGRLNREHGVVPDDERLREIEYRAVRRSWQTLLVLLFATFVGLLIVSRGNGESVSLLEAFVAVAMAVAILSRRIFSGYYSTQL